MLNPNGPFVLLNPISKLLTGETYVLTLSFSPRESILVSPRPTSRHAAPCLLGPRGWPDPQALSPSGQAGDSWGAPSGLLSSLPSGSQQSSAARLRQRSALCSRTWSPQAQETLDIITKRGTLSLTLVGTGVASVITCSIDGDVLDMGYVIARESVSSSFKVKHITGVWCLPGLLGGGSTLGGTRPALVWEPGWVQHPPTPARSSHAPSTVLSSTLPPPLTCAASAFPVFLHRAFVGAVPSGMRSSVQALLWGCGRGHRLLWQGHIALRPPSPCWRAGPAPQASRVSEGLTSLGIKDHHDTCFVH